LDLQPDARKAEDPPIAVNKNADTGAATFATMVRKKRYDKNREPAMRLDLLQ
jgi:hypothetical protein